MNSLIFLAFLGLSSAATIFEYKDEETGVHNVQTGEPGVQVSGQFSFNAPEGEQYKVVYTAGEEGYVPEAEHLPVVPEDTEDVAAARSSFMEAFMMAEERAEADTMMAEEMVEAEEMAEKMAEAESMMAEVVEAVRRKRSPVTIPEAESSPLTYSSLPHPLTYSPQPLTYSQYPVSYPQQPLTYYQQPLTYYQYPMNYAMQYPYYYPTFQSVSSPVVEEVGDMEEETMEKSAPAEPMYTSPVIRIGFEGLNPVQISPVQVNPVVPTVIQTVETSPERTVQQGDEEAAALAL